MLRFVADENFHDAIVRGLRRRDPSVDALRARDTPIAGRPDPEVIAWAYAENRVILTHDVQTFPGFSHAQVRAGEHTAGVFVLHDWLPIGQAIDELLTAHGASEMNDWVDAVLFLPI